MTSRIFLKEVSVFQFRFVQAFLHREDMRKKKLIKAYKVNFLQALISVSAAKHEKTAWKGLQKLRSKLGTSLENLEKSAKNEGLCYRLSKSWSQAKCVGALRPYT